MKRSGGGIAVWAAVLAGLVGGWLWPAGAGAQAVVRLAQNPAKAEEGPDSRRPMPLVYADDEMASFISRARESIGKKEYAEAIRILQALLDRPDQCFVPAAGGRLYVSLAEKARDVLGELPPAGMKMYRDLYDPLAERLYRAAVAGHDVAALAQIVRRFLHSSFGDDALDLLGSIHFDRGEFSQAARYWRAVIDSYAGTDLPPAVVLAKVAVAHHFAGEKAQAGEAEARLARHFPQAQAELGGEKTSVLAFVGGVLKRPAPVMPGQSLSVEGWHSLAGSPWSVATMQSCRPVMSPRWTEPPGRLEDNRNIQALIRSLSSRQAYIYDAGGRRTVQTTQLKLHEGQVVLAGQNQPLPALIHPVVTGNQVLYRAVDGVVAHDLLTAEMRWMTLAFPLYRAESAPGQQVYYGGYQVITAKDTGIRTLTVGGGKVFAVGEFLPPGGRMPYLRGGQGAQLADTSVLGAFSLEAMGKWVWRIGNGKGGDEVVRAGKFLTAPTYAAGRLYVLVEYLQAHYLVCLSADSGNVEWSVMVAQMPVVSTYPYYAAGNWEACGSPPAVADGRVFALTNAGVVGAFEADSGRPLWAYQYDSSVNRPAAQNFRYQRPPSTVQIDSPGNPIIVTRGRAILLPADSEKVLAVRVDSGEPVWEADRRGQLHLASVGDGQVVLAGPSVVVLDAFGGRLVWSGESRVRDVVGRPAVTDEAILASGKGSLVRVSLPDFRQVTRPPLVEPQRAILGNLVCVDGKLIAANAAGLSVYSTYEEARDELSARLGRAQPADRPGLLYYRGMNAFNDARPQEALGDLTEACGLAGQLDQPAVMVKVRQSLYRTYVALGNKARSEADRQAKFKLADGFADSDRNKGEMIVRWVKVHRELGDHARAAEQAQLLAEKFAVVELVDVEIGEEADPYVRDDVDTARITGRRLGERLIKGLIDKYGQGCYAAFDAKAKAALDAAVGGDNCEAMLRVVEDFRYSTYAPLALLRAAESRYRRALQIKDEGRSGVLGDALEYLGRLTREYPASGLGATAKVGLALVYHEVNPTIVWMALRDVEDIPPATHVTFADVSGTFADVLRRFAPDSSRLARSSPEERPWLEPPLEVLYTGGKFSMVVHGADGIPVRSDGRLFLLGEDRLSLFDPTAGSFKAATVWETQLPLDVARMYGAGAAGYAYGFAGGLSAEGGVFSMATRGGIFGVDVKTGKLLWHIDKGSAQVSALHSAAYWGNDLVTFESSGRIHVVDVRTGKQRWQHQVGRGFQGPPQVARGLLLAQHFANGWQATAFDMATGKSLGTLDLGRTSGQAVLSPQGLVVACDGRTLRLIEPAMGLRHNQHLWSVPVAEQLQPAVLAVTEEYVIVSPNQSTGVVEVRSLDSGRIARTLEIEAVNGQAAMPFLASVADNLLFLLASANPVGGRRGFAGGQITYCVSPSLHAYDLNTGERLWSQDVTPPGMPNYVYAQPPQVGREHLVLTVKPQPMQGGSGAVVLDMKTGKRVGKRIELPAFQANANKAPRVNWYYQHLMMSGPVMSRGRLVIATEKGVQVLGRKEAPSGS